MKWTRAACDGARHGGRREVKPVVSSNSLATLAMLANRTLARGDDKLLLMLRERPVDG